MCRESVNASVTLCIMSKLESVAIAMHCNLKAAQRHGSRSGLFLASFVMRMRTNCYSAASDQNSDIIIKFSDPDFLKRSSNLAIRRRFHAVTLTFDNWPWTVVVHNMSRDQTLYQIWLTSNNNRRNYWWFSTSSPVLCHAVTLTFDPLTLNVCCRSGVTWSDCVPK